MSGRVIEMGASLHRCVEALLPWYVNGTLDAEERARVESHLATCARCQAELAWESRLQATLALADRGDAHAAVDLEEGLAQLRRRIAASPSEPSRLARWRRAWRKLPRGWRWTVAAQGAAMLAMAVALAWPPMREPAYRALGAAPAAGAKLVVRFRPGVTEQDMRRVLRDSDARLVDGPTTTDAYLLSVPAGREQAALMRLRQDSAVLLVESLDAAR